MMDDEKARLKRMVEASTKMRITSQAAKLELLFMNHDIEPSKITIAAMRLCISNMEIIMKIGVDKVLAAAKAPDPKEFEGYIKQVYDGSKQMLDLLVAEHLDSLTKQ